MFGCTSCVKKVKKAPPRKVRRYPLSKRSKQTVTKVVKATKAIKKKPHKKKPKLPRSTVNSSPAMKTVKTCPINQSPTEEAKCVDQRQDYQLVFNFTGAPNEPGVSMELNLSK